MNNSKLTRVNPPALALATVLISSLACLTSTNGEPATAPLQPTATSAPVSEGIQVPPEGGTTQQDQFQPLQISRLSKLTFGNADTPDRVGYTWEITNPNNVPVPYRVDFVYRDPSGVFIDEFVAQPCAGGDSDQLFKDMVLAPPGRMLIEDWLPPRHNDADVEAQVTIPADCVLTPWGWDWDPEVQLTGETSFTPAPPCDGCIVLPNSRLDIIFRASDTLSSIGVVQVAWYDGNSELIGVDIGSAGRYDAIPPGEKARIEVEGPYDAVTYEIIFLGLSK